MPRCANPACPDATIIDLTRRHRWVQVREIELQQDGQVESTGTVQHLYAALTCSKSCAIAVLNAGLLADEAQRDEKPQPFPSHADQVIRRP